jgi:hypothetical protein
MTVSVVASSWGGESEAIGAMQDISRTSATNSRPSCAMTTISLQFSLAMIIAFSCGGFALIQKIERFTQQVNTNLLDSHGITAILVMGQIPIGVSMSGETTFANLIDTKEAAVAVGLTYSVMLGLRRSGKGPKCVKVGRKYLYDNDAVLQWRKDTWTA